MSNKKTWTVIVLLTALSLVVPMSARAGSYGHHGGHRSYGHRGYHGYGNHYGYHSGYGHHGYYGLHDYGYQGYHGYYAPHFYGLDGVRYRAVGEAGNLGAIDINVKPKRTQVYLNGNYIGMTGEFDGFPDYLWLEEGWTYELAFYNEGYLTVIREFAIHAGARINVNLRLVPGQSVLPEEL